MLFFIRIILLLTISHVTVFGQNEVRSRQKYYKARKYKEFNKCELVGKVKVKHYKHKKSSGTDKLVTIIIENIHVDTSIHSSVSNEASQIVFFQNTFETEVAELPHPEPVYFRFDSDHLDSVDYNQILLAVEHIKNGKKVKLHGHTDSHGHDTYNLHLSHRRAHKIKELMLALGVEEHHIVEVEGFGESTPVAHNNTHENRKLNRRVEFILL